MAAVTIVSYNGISSRAKTSSLKTELSQAAKKLQAVKITNGTELFPTTLASAGISTPSNITFTYTGGDASSFCLTGTYDSASYYVSSEDNSPQEGSCPVAIQTVTSSNCSTTRTVVTDARDSHSYWIQKLADGKCWMLTNLAYAGGGNNAYGDVMTTGDGTGGTISNGTGGSNATNTSAKYFVYSGKSNPTSSPNLPSTSTTGGSTGIQYGYYYNFCAANGGQSGNGACSSSNSTTVNSSVSICPTGWRLPTGGSGGDFETLNNTINSSSYSSSSGLLSGWLLQYGGYWSYGFSDVGSVSRFWSSTQTSITNANMFYAGSSAVDSLGDGAKTVGRSVRCIAQ